MNTYLAYYKQDMYIYTNLRSSVYILKHIFYWRDKANTAESMVNIFTKELILSGHTKCRKQKQYIRRYMLIK